jgi:MoxR-like ATPase
VTGQLLDAFSAGDVSPDDLSPDDLSPGALSSGALSPGAAGSRADAVALGARLMANIEQVVHGRRPAVELVVAGLLSGGHVLVQDVPGSGKTTLARSVARSIGGSFRRIQGTADLLPGDITGSSMWDPARHEFIFVPGPIFTNVLLVDELNRATPRAQSALLEAMDESTVTVDGIRHPLPEPFFVVATQNPTDQYGTFPLPEGQLDRFAVALSLGPNDVATERRVMREQLLRATVDELQPVLEADELRWIQLEVRRTHIADPVLDFALAVLEATRSNDCVRVGASSRAGLSLMRCAQAHALLSGRDYVVPDDVKILAPSVLGHRLVLADGLGGERGMQYGMGVGVGVEVVTDLLATVPVPLRG